MLELTMSTERFDGYDQVSGDAGPVDMAAISTGTPGRPPRFNASLEGFVSTVTGYLSTRLDLLRHARDTGQDIVAEPGREPRLVIGENMVEKKNAVKLRTLRRSAEVAGLTALTAIVVYKAVKARRASHN